MANYETEAVVIGSKNFGDADKMITLFTLQRGKIKAVAYGARRAKNPLAAPLQTFHIIDAELVEGGKHLDIIRNANLKGRYPKLESDLTRMAYALFIAEILAEIFPENSPEVEVYELSLDIFKVFEERNPRITADLAAWKLLSLAGFSMSLDICPLCDKKITNGSLISLKEGGFLCENCHTKDEIKISEGAKELLINFMNFNWEDIDKGLNFKIQGDKLTEVENILIAFLKHILGCSLKSLKFIRDISNDNL